jgi:hypothetical protein
MSMTCSLKSLGLAALAVLALSAGPALARNPVCDGLVRGLSSHYNPASGSGFLAVRAGPTASATQIGELFNGDHVEIFGHDGRWLRIYSSAVGRRGWVYGRWVRDNCPW